MRMRSHAKVRRSYHLTIYEPHTHTHTHTHTQPAVHLFKDCSQTTNQLHPFPGLDRKATFWFPGRSSNLGKTIIISSGYKVQIKSLVVKSARIIFHLCRVAGTGVDMKKLSEMREQEVRGKRKHQRQVRSSVPSILSCLITADEEEAQSELTTLWLAVVPSRSSVPGNKRALLPSCVCWRRLMRKCHSRPHSQVFYMMSRGW